MSVACYWASLEREKPIYYVFLTSLFRKYGQSVTSPKAHWYLNNCLLAPNRCPGSNIGGHKHAEVSGKPETEPFCWTFGVFFNIYILFGVPPLDLVMKNKHMLACTHTYLQASKKNTLHTCYYIMTLATQLVWEGGEISMVSYHKMRPNLSNCFFKLVTFERKFKVNMYVKL